MRKQIFLAAILIITACSGCAGTSISIEKPTVQLSHVVVNQLSFSGQTFILSFDVSNPNPFPLPVSAVRYHVQLADQTFASGETPGDFSIPARGNGNFDISVELDILKSASSLTGVLRGGMRQPVPYKLNGSLAVDIPFVKPVPFSTSGVITIASN
jgi:LEA14-like dessication related protein